MKTFEIFNAIVMKEIAKIKMTKHNQMNVKI